MTLILITTVLGFISIVISRSLIRLTFTPCLWYWVGWLAMLCGYELSMFAGILPEIRPFVSSLIIQSHIGAFLGFAIASFIIPVLRGIPGARRHQSRLYDIRLPERFIRIILWTYGLVGFVHLLYRVVLVGSITSSLFYDIRISYITNPYGFTRISSYLFTSVWIVAGLFGWEDACHGFRLKRLLALLFVSGLHGVAMGGRGWIVAVPLTYGVSYLLSSDKQRLFAEMTKLTRKLLWVFVIGFGLFVFLAVLRSPDPVALLAEERKLPLYQRKASLMMPLWYLALPIDGIDALTESFLPYSPTYGQLLFPWFAKQLQRLGMLEHVVTQEEVRDSLKARLDFRGWAQATILPLIVGDFGIGSVPYVMGVLMALSQIFAVFWRRRGIWKHSVAVMLTLAAFMTIQDTWFSGNVLGLGWAFILQWLISKYWAKERMYHSLAVKAQSSVK